MSQARRAFAAHPIAALLATGFGSGLSPIAPGTAGSLVGLLIAWLLASHVPILGSWLVVKPLGIARLQRLPGGWGVVADDLGGGLAAGLLLALAGRWI